MKRILILFLFFYISQAFATDIERGLVEIEVLNPDQRELSFEDGLETQIPPGPEDFQIQNYDEIIFFDEVLNGEALLQSAVENDSIQETGGSLGFSGGFYLSIPDDEIILFEDVIEYAQNFETRKSDRSSENKSSFWFYGEEDQLKLQLQFRGADYSIYRFLHPYEGVRIHKHSFSIDLPVSRFDLKLQYDRRAKIDGTKVKQNISLKFERIF